ncbi:MAG: site-specific integrase [Lachnospiraceae bacterium]|nr:site-specific integrase [Lachnospiraceae bacterium]
MSEKRRDNKGRILRTGESQRKNGMYEFRYTDANKTRRAIYDMDLVRLRKKEDEIKVMQHDGIDYAGGAITVIQLLERYIRIKRGVRYNTTTGYMFVMSVIQKEAFGQRIIRDIKISDAKEWFIKLFEDGYSYSTIASIRGVIKPAFQMAYNDDIIRRNPFEFRLDVIPNNTQKRVALTRRQQEQFLEFVKNDEHFCRYLDEIKILLGTGMRISEFCGLTISNLDFDRRRIRVDHQLVRSREGKRYIEKTKTECGCRYIPMSDEVYECFLNILSKRKKQKKEIMIDGYAGFILLDKNGNPKVAMHIQKVVQRLCEKYNEENIIPLPRITPHVFRHTFCTNMADAGMDLKSLQYLMGHSDASVTLNVYTHNSYEKAEESMAQIVTFGGKKQAESKVIRFG